MMMTMVEEIYSQIFVKDICGYLYKIFADICTRYLQSTGQMMSSVRLYFLPEYTLEGRQPHHGEVSTEIQIQLQIEIQIQIQIQESGNGSG